MKKKAIVLIDPVTEWKPMVQAAKQRGYVTIAVQLSPIEDRMKRFVPTPRALRDSGVRLVLNLRDRDAYHCAHSLQVAEAEEGVEIQAVIPLAETAVDQSDAVSAMLQLPHHNPLHLTTSRRDKGFMKETVRAAGLRVAKFARLNESPAIVTMMKGLQLTFPVVIKTPQGFSTTDVFICHNLEEANEAASKILTSTGPEGRRVNRALIEEYIAGTEFAVNVMACDGNIVVTDVWKYVKSAKARYSQADICDPNDKGLQHVVEYCRKVAEAVGVRYGAGHVEVKATQNIDTGIYVDPCMIEVGARLSGGRKATMTQASMGGAWDPFAALMDAHSGFAPTYPSSFSPKLFVRHLFLPIEQAGRIQDIQLDVTDLTTLHSQAMIVKKGEMVKETTDITSSAGFLWFVGVKESVERDSMTCLSKFKIIIL